MMEQLIAGARELGIALTAEQLARFELYYEHLVAWNSRVNLTAITDYHEVQVKHFLDSLTCLLALGEVKPGERLIDVGSGAGFPGLVLAIACPELEVTLLEATGKKAAFLKDVVSRLGLSEVRIVNARAEEAGRDPAHREAYDWAVARAVAALPELVEYLLPLCRVGGGCVAQKGSDIVGEIAMSATAIDILGGRLKRTILVQLPGLGELRTLVVISKVAPTPSAYPRRPGVPHKRPIR